MMEMRNLACALLTAPRALSVTCPLAEAYDDPIACLAPLTMAADKAWGCHAAGSDGFISLDASTSMFGEAGGDDTLVNWSANEFAHKVTKKHPKTYDEVAR
jgi:hypothetical protein